MSAPTMQQTPAIPPRPSRGSDKDASAGAMPKIPPRPVNKRLEHSTSPNPDRFAPSPFNEGVIPKSPKNLMFSSGVGNVCDPIERTGSVSLPSLGQEGQEYSAVTDELSKDLESPSKSRTSLPEQTRTIAEDLKLHAPKPSLPAQSAKQRVAAVTRTDSDKAASYGFGRPSFEERAASRDGLKKRPSTSLSAHSDQGYQTDEEHGIPEIGQRVPMNPYLGDVQAPSPAPGSEPARHHVRKHSARSLPPGSYGLHGHGVQPQDRLEKAWYQKHPDQLDRDQHTPIHDRQNGFALSSADLNKLVRDTVNRGSGMGTFADVHGTPTDEVAFQATEEYASRMSSPRPASAAPKIDNHVSSPLTQCFEPGTHIDRDDVIHVDDCGHPEYRSYGNEYPDVGKTDSDYPILASDEVEKDHRGYVQQPAIHLMERRGSNVGSDEGPSRPTSRPTSIHHTHSQTEFDSTPLEDVQEYEPLFPEETKEEKRQREAREEHKARHHFPSKDIWEDAPNSVLHTAQVSTPELPEHHRRRSSNHHRDRPLTPAQAFAQHQEELAEKELRSQITGGPVNKFLSLSEDKPTWIAHQPHLRPERPRSGNRFPSRDIWEDAPESQLHQTTIILPQQEEPQSKPEAPVRPAKKISDPSNRPAIPDRPKPKHTPSDDNVKVRPPVSDKPKPQIPSRPSKSLSGDSKDGGSSSKPKPPVPNRPMGSKIAALQAGFMSDLNKRLQIGPQGQKKEETSSAEEAPEEKEKAPLSDARKGRARGPQRRAPARSPAAAAVETPKQSIPVLTFSMPQTSWAINPDDGNLGIDSKDGDEPVAAEQSELADEPEALKVLDEASETDQTIKKDEGDQHDETNTAQPTEKHQVMEESEALEHQAEPEEIEAAAAPEPEEETLVANTAGESVLETSVEKKDEGNTVEPVEVDDAVKS